MVVIAREFTRDLAEGSIANQPAGSIPDHQTMNSVWLSLHTKADMERGRIPSGEFVC